MKRCDCGSPGVVLKHKEAVCAVCAGIEAYNDPHPLTPTPRRGFQTQLAARLRAYLATQQRTLSYESTKHYVH